MFGSSLGDLALRSVWNLRTHRSRMSSTSFRRTPLLSLTYAELRSGFPSRFIVLKVLVEAGLVAFSSACFEFAKEVPKDAQRGSLAHLPKFFPAIFTAFRKLLLWGSARRCLLASSLYCHAAFPSASTPGPAHQTCAPRGRLERDTNSATVESMKSAMSVAMSLIQVPSGIGGSASTVASATWHRRFGSVINRLRSASLGVSLVLSLFLRFGANLRGMRTSAYTRL